MVSVIVCSVIVIIEPVETAAVVVEVAVAMVPAVAMAVAAMSVAVAVAATAWSVVPLSSFERNPLFL